MSNSWISKMAYFFHLLFVHLISNTNKYKIEARKAACGNFFCNLYGISLNIFHVMYLAVCNYYGQTSTRTLANRLSDVSNVVAKDLQQHCPFPEKFWSGKFVVLCLRAV